MGSCAAGFSVGGGDAGNGPAVGIVFGLVGFLAFSIFIWLKDRNKLKNYVVSQGVRPDFICGTDVSGIGIDYSKKLVFAGFVGQGEVFSFDELSSVNTGLVKSGYHTRTTLEIFRIGKPVITICCARDNAHHQMFHALRDVISQQIASK